jgi:hypothetical protein
VRLPALFSVGRGSAFAVPLVLAALGVAGCEDRELHVFAAHRFDPVRVCLEGARALDVIDGPDPGPCDAARCWHSPAGDVYVTTTACDAPPDYRDGTGDPEGTLCAQALLALANGAHCAP